MIDIYRRAFRYYWSALPVLLCIMAFAETALRFSEPKHPSAVLLIPTLLVIYQFHRHFLFGEPSLYMVKPAAGAPPQKYGWFILISLALLLVPIGLGLIFAFAVAPDGSARSPFLGLFLLAMLPLYLLSLSLFGTALPASVARARSFRMTAGLRVSLGTMWRLILGPCVVQVLVLGLFFGAEYLLRNVPAYHSAVGQFLAGTIASMLGFLPSLMGVAVLCHMYETVMAAAPGSENTKAGQT